MRIQTTDELCSVDEMSQRATPYGFGLDCMLTPESAVAAHQEEIAGAELVKRVPDATRDAYERARLTHSYGAFAYDLYTVAHNHTRLVLELALRERFVEWAEGFIVLSRHSKTGETRTITADVARFGDVASLFDRGSGACGRGPWELQTNEGPFRFHPGLASLIRWARHIGLLRGQRNRGREQAMLDIRNYVAHPEGHLTVGPCDSARAIASTAEFINQLYGERTPGGGMYPPPAARIPVFIFTQAKSCGALRAEQFDGRSLQPSATVACFLAVGDDPGLLHANSWYETTAFPSEYLWGPGSPADAIAWAADADLVGDEVDPHDRRFVIDCSSGQATTALRPHVAAALDHSEPGRWLIVRADHPNDASTAADIYLGRTGREGQPTFFEDQIICDHPWPQIEEQVTALIEPMQRVTPEPVSGSEFCGSSASGGHTLAR